MSIMFACLVPGVVVCLVRGFRYNGLGTLALAAFGHCRPFGPASAQGIGRLRQNQLATRVNGCLLIDLDLV